MLEKTRSFGKQKNGKQKVKCDKKKIKKEKETAKITAQLTWKVRAYTPGPGALPCKIKGLFVELLVIKFVNWYAFGLLSL